MSETMTDTETRTPVKEVMLFRDARGWGVSATVGTRTLRHWRFHTERQARFMAAVLELGPRVLPAGSSGSRRHARLLGMREATPRQRQPHCGVTSTPWPGGPAMVAGPCESSSVPVERFGSLSSAVEAGLELASSTGGSRAEVIERAPWRLGEGRTDPDVQDDASLSAALDAALEAAFDEDEGTLSLDEGPWAASG